jgi:hypothetical protein
VGVRRRATVAAGRGGFGSVLRGAVTVSGHCRRALARSRGSGSCREAEERRGGPGLFLPFSQVSRAGSGQGGCGVDREVVYRNIGYTYEYEHVRRRRHQQ